jgi:hypothetical protein
MTRACTGRSLSKSESYAEATRAGVIRIYQQRSEFSDMTDDLGAEARLPFATRSNVCATSSSAKVSVTSQEPSGGWRFGRR